VTTEKKRSVFRGKYKSDPLSPFRPDRINAVREIKGLSVLALAQEADIPQPTLDCIVRGKTKRCRRSTLRSLARSLGVSVRWLSGEAVRLPLASFDRSDNPDAPALAQVAENRFLRRCLRAYRRDLEEWYPKFADVWNEPSSPKEIRLAEKKSRLE